MKKIKEHRIDYSEIIDYIYLGTNKCCDLHFRKSLLRKGIKADISLEKEKIDYPIGVDYFLWLPVQDKKAPTPKQLLFGSNFIKQLVDKKIKIYVHCKNGHGRSPTLIAAYFISKGKNVKQAISLIKRKRSSIHLTKPQIRSLENFYKNIKNQRRA